MVFSLIRCYNCMIHNHEVGSSSLPLATSMKPQCLLGFFLCPVIEYSVIKLAKCCQNIAKYLHLITVQLQKTCKRYGTSQSIIT